MVYKKNKTIKKSKKKFIGGEGEERKIKYVDDDYNEGDLFLQTQESFKQPKSSFVKSSKVSQRQSNANTKKVIIQESELEKQLQPKEQRRVAYDFDGVIHTNMEADRSFFQEKRAPNEEFKIFLYNNFELIKFTKTIEDMLHEQDKGSELFIISANINQLKDKIHYVLKEQGVNIQINNIYMNVNDKFKKCKELRIVKYFDDSWGVIKRIHSESKKENMPYLKELFYAVPDFYENNTLNKGLHFPIDLKKDLEQQKDTIKQELDKRFKKQAAFVALKDTTDLKYLVVLSKHDKKWMLPGGEVDKPPRDIKNKKEDINEYYGAIRELQEESGYIINTDDDLKSIRLKYIKHKSDHEWILYVGEKNFKDLEKIQRNKIFNSRETTNETSDYGFLKKDGIVYNYSGEKKKNQLLRGDIDDTVKQKLFQEKKSEEDDAPDAPDAVDTPDAPDSPDAPDTPDAPDAPDAVDTPDALDSPDAPDPPNKASSPLPSSPSSPLPSSPSSPSSQISPTYTGLPTTSIVDNINNAGNILPLLEPLPVLVGLVGLGVLLSLG